MRTISLISTYIIFNILLLTGCGDKTHNSLTPSLPVEQTNISTGRGNISFTVNWPDKVASTRVIPTNTTKIVVTVTQQGIKVGEISIIRPESTGTISNIPVGSVVVSAQAKDAANTVVASGSISVTVLLGQTVPAKLVLSADGISNIYGEKTNPIDGAIMVWVPGGTFTMGSIDGVGYSDEKPAHQVTLSGYWIGKYDVTVAQYLAFCAATGYALPTWPGNYYSWAGKSDWGDAALRQHPIINVTWYDAKAYADWAGLRLPTEAQWEYAARGPQGKNFPWGGTATAADPNNGWDQTKCANISNSFYQNISTWPVGSFPAGASWCGVLDMAGNVWQWCADWYGPYSATAVMNPTGPATGDYRMVRGGSWLYNGGLYRSASRNVYFPSDPTFCFYYLGFRCASPGP